MCIVPLTKLETALANVYPQDLEKLAADLLAERGYDVDPTGTKGTDGGIDALLCDGDRSGILHVARTRSDRIRGKITDDALKAAEHDREYDFFVFVTTADPSGSLRRRLEAELQEEYGWTVTIWAREQLRNALMANHQHLAREHLNVEPAIVNNEYEEDVVALRDERLDCIQTRSDLPNELPPGPAVALHLIPRSVFAESTPTPPAKLPSVPFFGHSKRVPNAGKVVSDGVVGYNHRIRTSHPDYFYLHESGWIEAVSTELFRSEAVKSGGIIDPGLDEELIRTMYGSLYCFDELEVELPVFASVALLDVGGFIMGSGRFPEFNTVPFPEQFTTEVVEIETLDPDEFEIEDLRPILDRIWYQAGRENGSPYLSNLDESSDE